MRLAAIADGKKVFTMRESQYTDAEAAAKRASVARCKKRLQQKLESKPAVMTASA
jgi:hypothetical protein